MSIHLNTMTFVILALAGWRLASLFANEAGMFGCFERLREYAFRLSNTNKFCRAFRLSEGLECEWCNSVWFGAGLTALWLAFGDAVMVVALPLALSTCAIVIKYIVQTLEQLREYAERLNKLLKEQPKEYMPVMDWRKN